MMVTSTPPLIDAQQWDKARCRPQTEWLAKTWDSPQGLLRAGYSRGAGGEDGLSRFCLARRGFLLGITAALWMLLLIANRVHHEHDNLQCSVSKSDSLTIVMDMTNDIDMAYRRA
jgi:hypothetical protein